MKCVAFLLCLTASVGFAQETKPSDTLPSPDSLIANLPARNVGPTTMGGRITALAVYEKEPRIMYIGAATGGVWKTENGGLTTTPVWFKEGSSGAGAIAVSQKNPDLVYVASGEGTSRNSSGYGDGVYKSTDGGKTWANVGLRECTHFSAILIDPRNDDVVYAAGLGNLWGYNAERGVFKSTDGGKTWNKILFVDDKTGVACLVMDPKKPDTLMAAMWEKIRAPYDWTSGGPGSALMKTTNGGKSWKKITKGLPEGGFYGRIGLDYFRTDSKVMVATVEHRKGDDRSGSGFYRSEDGGESWKKGKAANGRPFYFSIPRQDPLDINRIYVPTVQILSSDDKGETFKAWPTSVHVDHHVFWINPNDSNHVVIGEDGGLAVTNDRGKQWRHINNMPLGQFYAISFDMRKPYWVYGGLQDNGSWASPTQSEVGGVTFMQTFTFGGGDGFYTQNDPEDWRTAYSESQGGFLQRFDLSSGAGRSIRPNNRNCPNLAQGERLRFNWNSPFILSPFNSKTLYFGGNRLFKSVNRGDNWLAISPDLTTNDPAKQAAGKNSATPEDTGAERHCTIVTVSESPRRPGVLWVGTDDGLVHVSENDGDTWTNVTANIPDLPKNTWVSRIHASNTAIGRAYATFDGHRTNDYKTYVYMTDDFGKTWTKLNGNLPANEPCHVLRDGLKNEDLLVLGTEMGLYVSLDRGKTWAKYTGSGFPTVPVHDLQFHPRDGDLVIGTHGRSIWTMPISALEELTAENLGKDAFLCKPAPAYYLGYVQGKNWDGDGIYMAPNTQPGTTICYFLKADDPDAKVTVTDIEGQVMREITTGGNAGLNVYSLRAGGAGGRGGRGLFPGDYRVTLKSKDKEYVSSFRVEDVSGK